MQLRRVLSALSIFAPDKKYAYLGQFVCSEKRFLQILDSSNKICGYLFSAVNSISPPFLYSRRTVSRRVLFVSENLLKFVVLLDK